MPILNSRLMSSRLMNIRLNAKPLLLTLFCVVWLGIGALVHAEEDAAVWLERMQHAAVTQNYQGTFVLTRGDITSTQKIFHRHDKGVEHERILQVDGSTGEVLRKDGAVTCILPENKAVHLEPSAAPGGSAAAFAHIMPDSQFYLLRTGKTGRVANRPCQQIRIEARDEYRYSYSLWLDQATGLLLKSQTYDVDGSVLERFQFTSIEFPEVIHDSDLALEQSATITSREVIPVPPRDRLWPDGLRWHAQWLPPGFAASHERPPAAQNMMVFSDGMAAFSVFIEAVSHDPMPEGASRLGATTAYAQTLSHEPHRYAVTVVGEIPPLSAMKVAEAVRPLMQ